MAKRVEVTLVDDIDGSEAHETVQLAVDGATVEIDLSTGNAGRLRAVLAPYLEAGRRTATRKVQVRAASKRDDLAKIRQWGRDNGFNVSDRGRVAETVRSAYEKAQSASQVPTAA